MRYVFVILDGAGDRGSPTPFEAAKKPNMDFLAKHGKVGLVDVGYKKSVNSDFGYLSLLGCYDEHDYPGRGYIEALGVGLTPGENDVCIRCNFATLDARGNVKDRRAGREESGLDMFCENIDGMEIDGVRFSVRKSAGHRAVLVLSGRDLSDQIYPNDPMKTGVPLMQVKPKSPEGKKTANILNKFITRITNMLAREPFNKKRKYKASTMMIRSVGHVIKTKTFNDRFGLNAVCIAGIPVAFGVARFLGMDTIHVAGANGMPDTNLKGKTDAVLRVLKDKKKKHDFIFLHINGTDILAHDRKREQKKKLIEKIDSELGRIMKAVDLKKTVFVVTCDHRTVSLPKSEFPHYEHVTDPVPAVVSGGKTKPDKSGAFGESVCSRGFRFKAKDFLPSILGK